ncbi:hypothetical protein SDC9_119664 [bioreactor metagenome]|uniref:Uncharacterized protein n=1 Tax=bioreactor metagenome TaxID=1076179 RepID=A0A645C5P5_9ZZZZ
MGQRQNILLALPQRRNGKRYHVEPVVQVVAEGPRGDHRLKIPVGGHDNPDIQLDAFGSSHPLQLPLLKHPQQLGLHIKAHFTDFIQKNGAAVGQLEFAHFPALFRPGKRALFIAEQLRLQQIFRNGRAVYLNEGVAVPAAGVVDGLRHDLLAHAAFPENQHGAVGAGHLGGQLQRLFQGGVLTDIVPKRLGQLRVTQLLLEIVGHLAGPLQILGCLYQLGHVVEDAGGAEQRPCFVVQRNGDAHGVDFERLNIIHFIINRLLRL